MDVYQSISLNKFWHHYNNRFFFFKVKQPTPNLNLSSNKADPNVYAVDAFSLNWNEFQFYVLCFFKNWQSIKYTDSKTHWLIQPFLLKNDENEKESSNNNTSQCNKFSSPKQQKIEVNTSAKADLMICHVSGKNS